MVPPTRTPGTQLRPGQLANGGCRTSVNYATHLDLQLSQDVTSLQWQTYIQELSYHSGIPIDFRIGITGHRKLGDSAALVPAIWEAVPRARFRRGWLAARVVLPMSALDETYDFRDEQSRKQFRHLLRQASQVGQAPARTIREEACEWAAGSVGPGCGHGVPSM
jgi:hypothetical protein